MFGRSKTHAAAVALLACVSCALGGGTPDVGEPFPDVAFFDAGGQPFQLSQLKGRVVLVEFASMSCQACIAFSGGQYRGGYAGRPAQPGLPSLDTLVPQYARVSLSDPRIAFVQVFLFDENDESPTAASLMKWNMHFGSGPPNQYRVAGATRTFGSATRKLVPAFFLIDRDGIVRHETAGDPASLYTVLLPAVSSML